MPFRARFATAYTERCATRRFGERGGICPNRKERHDLYVFTHATVLDGTEGMEPQSNMTVVVNEGVIEKVGPAASTTVRPWAPCRSIWQERIWRRKW